ncbi:MAG: serine protease [Akkermansiaceae bacterium]|nr:serine protease [Akkermansiaceae bacterium]
MKTITYLMALSLAVTLAASAQFEFRNRAETRRLENQTIKLFESIAPAVARAAKGTVEVRVWRKRSGYGTVVAPGKVLAKWSEVRRAVDAVACRTDGGQWLPAKVEGIYRDDDLVMLSVEGLRAEPVILADADGLELGDFLVLARPDGEAASMGVVSVLPRSLRHADRAFLGVQMDLDYDGPGVRIEEVRPNTGAETAGLRPRDIITGMNGKAMNGNFELSSALQRLSPGETISLKFRRGDEQKSARIKLGGRVDPPKISRSRMERMNRLGGQRYNEFRDGFQNVIQSDMQIEPEDCGAPVVNLHGDVVGIAVARAGRIKSFILPSGAVKDHLAEGPEQPAEDEMARIELNDPGELVPWQRREPPLKSMREHMDEMRRFMDQFEEEFGR